jgi:hypothetical protein
MNNYSAKIHGGVEPGHMAARHQDRIQTAAKVGWATKGGLYITLGTLALMAAFGSGGQLSGGGGVIEWLAQQAFGNVLLVLAGIGFTCYAIWRVIQVIVTGKPPSA